MHHNQIVPVYAVGCDRGVHYYAMQFIDGQSLAEIIQELRELSPLHPGEQHEARSEGARRAGAVGNATTSIDSTLEARSEIVTLCSSLLDPRSSACFRAAAELIVQAALALEHAHQLGVVHRDIKPANLLVDASGNLWITDFGLARGRTEQGLTHSEDLVGTLRYMSPEQALAKHGLVDHRTMGLLYNSTKQPGPAEQEWARAIEQCRLALPHDEQGEIANDLAWYLVDCPDLALPAPAEAVGLARKAVTRAPGMGEYWNTLGVAHYRAGEFQSAVITLCRSMELRSGGDGADHFFLAMAYERLGDPQQARIWYDKAVQGMVKRSPQAEGDIRYREEAKETLGIKE